MSPLKGLVRSTRLPRAYALGGIIAPLGGSFIFSVLSSVRATSFWPTTKDERPTTYLCSLPNALISTSTPAGKSSFISASTVCCVESVVRSTCSSSWAMESAPRFARRCASPFRRSHPWIDPGCDSRTPSAGYEFFLFQSRFAFLTPAGYSGRKELAASCKPQ